MTFYLLRDEEGRYGAFLTSDSNMSTEAIEQDQTCGVIGKINGVNKRAAHDLFQHVTGIEITVTRDHVLQLLRIRPTPEFSEN